jgi:hypothetical protein
MVRLAREKTGSPDGYDVPSILQDTVEKRLGEIVVVQDLTPLPQRFIGGEAGVADCGRGARNGHP